MVAYSFQPSFVPEIAAGRKQQTIRNPRKRHARVGEPLQLYTGMRTRSCALIGRATCLAIRDVRLDFALSVVTLDDSICLDDPSDLDAFAFRDGFNPRAALRVSPWAFMAKWWSVTHPDNAIFRGVLIDWGKSFEFPQ